uniref:Uncharacterized protein n=1 Tax=Erwinia amylovora ATCC BAA-2158 TaxID=889211 RepID=E5B557_ERWAM|nr:hypothetical protein predicted by Glimmer/Critica [Erwinia amylovora ATCC BAA-2158]
MFHHEPIAITSPPILTDFNDLAAKGDNKEQM